MEIEPAVKVAVVQHGDYEAALHTIVKGRGEPYFGMTHSVEILQRLMGGRRHLVLSLCKRRYRVRQGDGLLVGVPEPWRPRAVPQTLTAYWWSHRIMRELREFAPTHLLLRTSGLPGLRILQYAVSHRVSTLAIFASFFTRGRNWRERLLTRRFLELLNDPSVHRVGNHRWPAAESLIHLGVDGSKVVAWDWPNLRSPKDYPPKRARDAGRKTIIFVGTMVEAKGLGDLIDAVALLRKEGRDLRLVCAGEGPRSAWFRRKAEAAAPDAIEFLGLVANEEAFRLMREADLVCIPSRRDYPEGMPLTVTEALASRTPVIASDHPALKRVFIDGEGVRFFRGGKPNDLAMRIQEVLEDPLLYHKLSREASVAFFRAVSPTTFGAIVQDWVRGFPDGCELLPSDAAPSRMGRSHHDGDD